MKILVISHEYPPIGGGGGQVVADVCTQLASRGHQVYVLTALFGDLPRMDVQGNLTIERIPSCRTQAYRAGFMTMACFILKAIGHGSRIIRRFKPDVIQAHFAVPAGAAAYVLSSLFRVPYVITAHGGDVPGGAPQKTDKWFRLVLPFTRPFWKKAARVISVSEQTRRFALQHYPVDIQVVPNGIDTQACQPGKFDPHYASAHPLHRPFFTRKERGCRARRPGTHPRFGLAVRHVGRRPRKWKMLNDPSRKAA